MRPPPPSQQQQQQQWPVVHEDILLQDMGSPRPGSVSRPKISTIMEQRLRKKRRTKLCIIAVGVLILFFVALVLGVGLGVLKGEIFGHGGDHDDDNGNKSSHGPPQND